MRKRGDTIQIRSGETNAVLLDEKTAVYEVPEGMDCVERLLLTDAWHDRYVCPPKDVTLVVPGRLLSHFTGPEQTWAAREASQYHDYAQESLRAPITAQHRVQAVHDGEELVFAGGRLLVAETSGRTRGSMSYLTEVGSERVAFLGDLVYDEGRLLDLHSLQGSVPEAELRGYHGYAARARELVASVRRILEWGPTLVIPAHGPVIESPVEAMEALLQRLQVLLKSHFETDALLWYWGIENQWVRSRVVEGEFTPMATAELRALPEDIIEFGTSRLLRSSNGEALLIDAGYPTVLPTLRALRASGWFSRLIGLWITHYHDDHCDYANAVTMEFDCDAWFIDAMSAVLADPPSFSLPCLPSQPVERAVAMREGSIIEWNEWTLTAEYFPGQTLYHGGLLAVHEDGRSYYFAGDSFTPTGLDDYCMHNRNLYGAGLGYERCLERLLDLPDTWILNQHVKPTFRFSRNQIGQMQEGIRRRRSILSELSPWPNINCMVDASWASVAPYRSTAKEGEDVRLDLRLRNDGLCAMEVAVEWHASEGLDLERGTGVVVVSAGQEAEIGNSARAQATGLHPVVCNLLVGGVPRRAEALVRVV